MKYNKSEIFKTAWLLRKAKACRTWGECLKIAWFEAKSKANAAAAKAAREANKADFTGTATFEGAEFRFWNKCGKRRIYINGGINNRWNGSYINLDTGEIVTRRSECRDCAARFMESHNIAC